jgi:hypothetical protein
MHLVNKREKSNMTIIYEKLIVDLENNKYTKERLLAFLKIFIETNGENTENKNKGMCYNINSMLGLRGFMMHHKVLEYMDENKEIGSYNFPINDESSEFSADDQFSFLPHYKGRQLELRIELSKRMIEIINMATSSINYIVEVTGVSKTKTTACTTVSEVWKAIGNGPFGALYTVTSPTGFDVSKFTPF